MNGYKKFIDSYANRFLSLKDRSFLFKIYNNCLVILMQ